MERFNEYDSPASPPYDATENDPILDPNEIVPGISSLVFSLRGSI